MIAPFQIFKNPVMFGIALGIAQTLAFSVLTLLIKLVQDEHHPVDMLLYRNSICTAIAFIFLIFIGKVHAIRKANLKRQIIRGVVGSTGMILTFVTFAMLPLTEAQSLLFAAPLFVVLLSYPLLKEKVGIFRTSAAIVGFLGVMLIMQPGTISSFIGGLFGLATALSHACVMITLRWLGRTEDPFVTIFYFSLISLIVILPFVPFYWTPPSAEMLVYLISLGIVAFFVQYFLTKAYFMAPASVIAPLIYFNLLWAMLIDIMILGNLPSLYTLIGAFIIILSNLFILWRQHKKEVTVAEPINKI